MRGRRTPSRGGWKSSGAIRGGAQAVGQDGPAGADFQSASLGECQAYVAIERRWKKSGPAGCNCLRPCPTIVTLKCRAGLTPLCYILSLAGSKINCPPAGNFVPRTVRLRTPHTPENLLIGAPKPSFPETGSELPFARRGHCPQGIRRFLGPDESAAENTASFPHIFWPKTLERGDAETPLAVAAPQQQLGRNKKRWPSMMRRKKKESLWRHRPSVGSSSSGGRSKWGWLTGEPAFRLQFCSGRGTPRALPVRRRSLCILCGPISIWAQRLMRALAGTRDSVKPLFVKTELQRPSQCS